MWRAVGQSSGTSFVDLVSLGHATANQHRSDKRVTQTHALFLATRDDVFYGTSAHVLIIERLITKYNIICIAMARDGDATGLQFEHVCVDIEDKRILWNVSGHALQGHVLAFLGPSGK